MNDLSRITVLGTGVLGSQIAYHTAYQGFDVVAYNVGEAGLDRARARLQLLAERYVREVDGAGTDGRAHKALQRITLSRDLAEAVGSADLVIESVPEQPQLKKDILAEVGALAPAHTVIATNTSTLRPSELMESTGRPSRFLALHFSNLIWRHNVAEVMGTPETDPEVYASVVRFASAIGMVPVEIKKEKPGYLLNSLLVPLLNAAGELLTDDIATPSAVDDVWRIGTGALYGPFQMMDIIGLTTVHHVASQGNAKHQEFARLVKERYLDKGKLGVETGEGFHVYPEGGS
jgi:3-hydroxybutyryl-CoA dehydrogenase